MHRWFRFCALIALMAFVQRPSALAQATDEVPVSKHQIKPTTGQVVQHGFDSQGKKLDQIIAQLTALADAQKQQIDAQAKALEALTQKVDLQARQIETLNGDLNRLNTTLLARQQTAPAEPVAHAPAPAVQTTSSPANASTDPTPAAVKAEPVSPDGMTADGQPTHLVKRGETLTTIARAHSTSVSELLRVNKIEDERKLQIGQTLILPKGATAQPSAPTTPQSTPTP